MALRSVVYDITRLATRFSRRVPNGIDRVDLGYATHFLAAERGAFGLMLGGAGPRLVGNAAAWRVVEGITRYWREESGAAADESLARVRRALALHSPGSLPAERPRRSAGPHGLRAAAATFGNWDLLGRNGMFPGSGLRRHVPRGAVYISTSQFPLWIDRYYRWLDDRPDVKAVFFIHDVLPLTHPEFFPPAEAGRHAKRLEVASRRANGLIVASQQTLDEVGQVFRSHGKALPPSIVLPLPVSQPFRGAVAAVASPGGALRRYFVSVGTLEPRKNHLLLLNIWRELRARLGDACPVLVLVGVRGWENENAIDLIERCPSLKGWVIEVGRLSTPALAALLADCQALLMPSYAEGFGLPVAEACAAGIPVIASDIAVFRERATAGVTLLDPLDGLGWLQAIVAESTRERASGCQQTRHGDGTAGDWPWHIGHVEHFLGEL